MMQKLSSVPHVTSDGRPIDWYVQEQITRGVWREEVLAPEITGTTRSITVVRAPRKTNLIEHDWHGDKLTFCPPMWWDLAIGSGACSFACRSCFLLLTHRIRRDPMRHLLYDNVDDFTRAAEKWLQHPERRRQHTLGVGIDRSDSLLYEAATGHVHNLAPLFGNPVYNPRSNKLILLTKSANTHLLADIKPEHRNNIVVTFSLNPESVADLWEGKWPDTGERITPPIAQRLDAAMYAQDLGYEIRARIDPILTPPGWEDAYADFIANVKARGLRFKFWTLGTYREKLVQLDAWRERWGLLAMEWQPAEGEMIKDGTHRHLPEERRIAIYTTVRDLLHRELPMARVSLCKETHTVRRALQLCNADCNCLV
jgi:DNA repair photolyase